MNRRISQTQIRNGISRILKNIFWSMVCIYVISVAKPAEANENTMAFLKRGIGAKALSLGGAFVAVADDATSVYWNPAGLTQNKKFSIAASYDDRFGIGVKDQYVSFGKSWKNIAFGIAFVRTSIDKIPRTKWDEYQRPLLEGYFETSDNALFLSTALRIFKGISVGVNGKYFYSQLDKNSGSGADIDVGLLLQPVRYVRFGVNAQNLREGKIAWDTGYEDALSRNIKVGLSFSVFKEGLLVSSEIDKWKYRGGIEISPVKLIKMRGGVSIDRNGNKKADWTAGIGLAIWFLRLDFAHIPHDLGATNQIMLTLFL